MGIKVSVLTEKEEKKKLKMERAIIYFPLGLYIQLVTLLRERLKPQNDWWDQQENTNINTRLLDPKGPKPLVLKKPEDCWERVS